MDYKLAPLVCSLRLLLRKPAGPEAGEFPGLCFQPAQGGR